MDLKSPLRGGDLEGAVFKFLPKELNFMGTEIFNISSVNEKRKNLRNNTTEAEKKLWNYIRNEQLGVKFRRQYSISHYIADFYSPTLKLVIELDGSQHFTPEALEYDKIREEFMNTLGIKTIRFNNNEVMTNIEGVLERIKENVKRNGY